MNRRSSMGQKGKFLVKENVTSEIRNAVTDLIKLGRGYLVSIDQNEKKTYGYNVKYIESFRIEEVN